MSEDEIKNFTLNIDIKNYKEFIDYFHKLNLKKKNVIISTVILYKYSYKNIKNGNLDKIYNMYEILLHKLEFNELNGKERDVYETINAFLILYGAFENNDLFEKYCDKYLRNINKNNFNKKTLLVMQDMLNILNKKNNTNYRFCMREQREQAMVSFANKNTIFLNHRMYEEFYFEEPTEKVDLVKTLFYQIFIVLHEYKHLNQCNYLYHFDDRISNNYKKELYLVKEKEKFYKKFHDSFIIEKEANKYAFDEIFNYISKYFKNVYIDKNNLKEFIISKHRINQKDAKIFLFYYKLYLLFYKTNIKIKKLTK